MKLTYILLFLCSVFTCLGQVDEDFDANFGSSYDDYINVGTNGGFDVINGLSESSSNARGGSGRAVRLRNNGSPSLTYSSSDGNGKDGGVGTVSFWYRHWDADGSTITFDVEYSTNAGGMWNAIGSSTSATSTTYTQFTEVVDIAGDNILVRVNVTSPAERLIIDDFIITNFSSGCPINLTYSNPVCETVTSNTDNYSYDVTFTGGGQGAGTYTFSSSSGTTSGDDPNLVVSGTINVTGVPETSDDIFMLSDGATCMFSESITAPNCEPIAEIYINEFVADPTTNGLDLNTNHDFDFSGNPIIDGQDDEMIELVWLGAGALDLTGWTLSDAVGVRHTFGNVQLTPTIQYAVVFGGGDLSNIQNIIPDAYFATASTGNLGLNNGNDDIELRDNMGNLIRSVSYSTSGGDVANYDDNEESSWGRDPDGTGAFVRVASITPAETFYTPGESNSVQSALPVNYVYYNVALMDNNKVKVSWATAQEVNNERFDIQRSLEGGLFETISSINGKGNYNQLSEYEFIDERPPTGLNYYRIRQLDFEGHSSYSTTKAISVGNPDRIKLYPSLVQNELFYNVGEEKAKLILMSHDGSVYKEMYLDGNGQIDMSIYAPGMYTVTINTIYQTTTQRIIKI
jgi:hypothetical protein